MASIRRELINTVRYRVSLINHAEIDKQHELRKQATLTDKSLTNDEKLETIRILTGIYDIKKVIRNKGIKKACENCKQKCFATSFCEHYIRDYLLANFFRLDI